MRIHCVGYGRARVSVSIFTGVIEYENLFRLKASCRGLELEPVGPSLTLCNSQ